MLFYNYIKYPFGYIFYFHSGFSHFNEPHPSQYNIVLPLVNSRISTFEKFLVHPFSPQASASISSNPIKAVEVVLSNYKIHN